MTASSSVRQWPKYRYPYTNDVHLDDSYSNCKNAKELGWTAAHLVEEGLKVPKTKASQHQIQHLEELRSIFSQFFRPEEKDIDT